jgi:hypothetical protein
LAIQRRDQVALKDPGFGGGSVIHDFANFGRQRRLAYHENPRKKHVSDRPGPIIGNNSKAKGHKKGTFFGR